MTDVEHYPLRLPSDLKSRIRERAGANRRSMNSEIVHCLDRALGEGQQKGPVGTAIPPGRDHDNSLSTEKANELDEQ